jgi:hypothetical protein
MPLPLLAIAGAVAAVAGLAKSYVGARQANKAAKLAAQNTRPEFDIADEYFTNQTIAQNQAQSGLGQDTLDYYTNQAGRGFTQGTDAILQTGGGPNAIAGLYDRYQQGIAGIGVANAQARNQNINNLMSRNADIAAQRTMAWSLNKYEPYKDTARTAANLQAQGTQNIFNGISQFGSSLGTMSQAGLFSNGNAGSLYSNPQANADTAIRNVLPSATVSGPNYGMMGSDMQGVDNSILNDTLQEIQNSPYKDLIQQRLLQNYNRMNPAQVA